MLISGIAGDASPDDPATHALIVGVSRYPFAAGAKATDFGRKFRLRNLTSAARSASKSRSTTKPAPAALIS